MADGQLYEVEQLLQRKLEKKQVYYLVRWKNFSAAYDTWEPAKNLRACQILFRQFDKTKKATKSSCIASKLLKKSKALSNAKEEASKINNVISRKKSQIIARQKIAAELKSKSKHLANLGTVSAQTLKINSKKVKKPVQKADNPISNDKMSVGLEASHDSSVKSPAVKKKTVEQTDSAKKAGTKRTTETPVSVKKYASHKKKLKQDVPDSPKHKTSSTKNNGPNTSNENKDVSAVNSKTKTEKNDLKKNQTAKLQSGSSSETPKASKISPKNKNSNKTGSKVVPKASKKVLGLKAPNSDSFEDISIISDSESDDDDVLYSLNDGVNAEDDWEENEKKSESGNSTSVEKNGIKTSSKKNTQNVTHSKKMSLIDFKKPKTSKQKPGTFDQLLRPSSPTPFFTPLKAVPGPQLGVMPNNSLTMDSLVGDVPTIHAAPAGPLSPSTTAYKTMLESLPGQMHPKGKKKKENSNGASTSSGSSSGQSVQTFGTPVPIERRTSVRATECAFRYKQIVVKKCHRYTQIWLNTQTILTNAINPQVVQEVVAALNTAKYDDSSLVLFSGIGNYFCSGVDLHFLTTGDRRVAARQMADALRELTKAFITFPKPVIAAVGGSAVGLGVAMLCLCDIVYASDKAVFHLPYTKLSQTPEGCSSFTLPQNLGLAAANELLLGGRRITAMEAGQLGLVSRVFWPTGLMQQVIPRAQNMAEISPKVLENNKLLTRSHHRTKMELTNETECNVLLERWSTSECQRAIEAYLADQNNFSS